MSVGLYCVSFAFRSSHNFYICTYVSADVTYVRIRTPPSPPPSPPQLRCRVIEWHPDVATQMVLASEADQSPIIQVRTVCVC